ncbi:FAD-linked oxidase C-terminal domain-containing protein [Streptomyces sp. NBC_00557]|uniref:FAD-linked oxidase C-terminal domain-containing protein n=1 Tax=Streptomyces sp. NBC_00557 TaxID=2975776 RepID=UPI003FCC4AEB
MGTFGRAADGNLHPTVVYDATDRDTADRVSASFDDIVAAALELGGTITGEHGVGSLKTRCPDAQLGPTERELMAGIKGVFDPGGILNPGRGGRGFWSAIGQALPPGAGTCWSATTQQHRRVHPARAPTSVPIPAPRSDRSARRTPGPRSPRRRPRTRSRTSPAPPA